MARLAPDKHRQHLERHLQQFEDRDNPPDPSSRTRTLVSALILALLKRRSNAIPRLLLNSTEHKLERKLGLDKSIELLYYCDNLVIRVIEITQISERNKPMPAPVRDLIISPESVRFQVASDPVINVLHSMMLLLRVEELSGLDDWIVQTAESLPKEVLERHAVVMWGLHYAIMPTRSFDSFPEYLNYLETTDPLGLGDQLLDKYFEFPPQAGIEESRPEYSRDEIISNVDTFLSFLRSRFDQENFYEHIERKAYELLRDPAKLQSVIVENLRMLWTEYFEAEFQRRKAMIDETIEAFGELDFSGMSDEEAVRFITRRWDDKLCDALEKHNRIVFVPSPHTGPHSGPLIAGDTFWMMFNCRLPESTPKSASRLSRAEVLVWLSALADDTRLQILALLKERGELCAQDIISALDTSQSTASRHLRQLSASGYVREHRTEAGKCYRLNPERFEDTIAALETFII